MVRHGKKRIRFGSEGKKKIPDFVDPNKDPRSYLRRYIAEQTYKDWFNRNYPVYTIYEAVGLSELDFQEIPSNHPIYHQKYNFNTLPKIHEHNNKPAQGFGIFYKGRLRGIYLINHSPITF